MDLTIITRFYHLKEGASNKSMSYLQTTVNES